MAAAGGDPGRIESMVARRCQGEPLAWIVGRVPFAGALVAVSPGVYVPRHQTEALVRMAARALPPAGRAVDLCTGSGAVAVALQSARPDATVVATELDPTACECARVNGVEVYQGDLDRPLPAGWAGSTDVVTAVAPYVPTGELQYLPRDVLAYEPRAALDGGPGGTVLLERVVAAAARLLRPGGILIVELGADQDDRLAPVLSGAGFTGVETSVDDDGDLRALRARWHPGL
ncbi:MAG TPA: HemK/PrmC family methyltransferase [Acidimicrobiales bacterium]|jgi:release factor glutamine methyltransferase|nr:HemK/PrmC family methyltransferase [Acidimicrobiales bacterium]